MRVADALVGQVLVCADVGAGASGVTYAVLSGRPLTCGTDSNGAVMYVVVDQTFSTAGSTDSPVEGGAPVGAAIGGAMLLVLATAWGIRTVRDFINSSSES